MYCSKCGSEVDANHNYCGNCGKNIERFTGRTDKESIESESAPSDEPLPTDESTNHDNWQRKKLEPAVTKFRAVLQSLSGRVTLQTLERVVTKIRAALTSLSGRLPVQKLQKADPKEVALKPSSTHQSNKSMAQTAVASLTKNWKSGAVIGAVTYIIGYIFTYASMVNDGVPFTYDQTPFAKEVGWVFYSAQNVGLRITRRGETETIQLFGEFGYSQLTDTVPEIAYRAFPAIALIFAGLILYRRGRDMETTTVSAVVLGATSAVGYLTFAVLGRMFFKVSLSEGEFIAQPPLIGTTLIIGLMYPIVFGGIGGVIGHKLS